MQHLDEGVLQAWLDRPRSGMSGPEAEGVERHLAGCPECSARLTGLEADSVAAIAILADAEPRDIEVPDFSSVLTRAGRRDGARMSMDRWASLGWAASLVLALGLGWLSNDFYRSRSAAPTVSQVAERSSADPRDAQGGGRVSGGGVRVETVALPPASEPDRPAEGAVGDGPEAVGAGALPEPELDRVVGLAAASPDPEAEDIVARTMLPQMELATPATQGIELNDAGRRTLAEAAGFVEVEAREDLRIVAIDSDVWTVTTLEGAAALLGRPPLFVEGLEVLEVGLGEVDGEPAVRVEQALSSGDPLILLLRRDDRARSQMTDELSAGDADGPATVTLQGNGLLMTGFATLETDSLRTLLGRAR